MTEKMMYHGYAKRVAKELGLSVQTIAKINGGNSRNAVNIARVKKCYERLLAEDLAKLNQEETQKIN